MVEHALASTATLIRRVQGGDDSARDVLAERCLPLLERWARGRLPAYGRDLSETDDIVQMTMVKGLSKVNQFQPQRQGAFLAYMRQILVNTVRDEIRRSSVRARNSPLEEEPPDAEAPSIFDQAAHRETLNDYEGALAKLSASQREAVVLRVEFGMTFSEVAAELEMNSANSARMKVTRALRKLASMMP